MLPLKYDQVAHVTRLSMVLRQMDQIEQIPLPRSRATMPIPKVKWPYSRIEVAIRGGAKQEDTYLQVAVLYR